jgi:hypothetical protein
VIKSFAQPEGNFLLCLKYTYVVCIYVHVHFCSAYRQFFINLKSIHPYVVCMYVYVYVFMYVYIVFREIVNAVYKYICVCKHVCIHVCMCA